ncbi:hypothetical protein CLCR_04923 [Cladophialophora carrionii]|uniref:Cytochrome P450 n=1 Tax=Cladophialophora carrionii TaxID=86049 RepID=A0A1C1CLT7_9EURO|nr:hypothetical protein CLCR_04923 [Cladophialophora carrionii]
MKTIYDRDAIKTSFYKGSGRYKGVQQILGTLDYKTAAPARANLLQCFQNKNLESLSDVMESHINTFIRLLYQRSEQDQMVFDGVLWLRLLTLDTVTDILWGDQHNLLTNLGDQSSGLLVKFHSFSKFAALKGFIPGFEFYARFLGSEKYRSLRREAYDLDSYARSALQKWQAGEKKGHTRDVLSMLMSMNSLQDPSHRIAPEHMPAYMVEMMSAGSSTTSNTATIAFWLLARNKEIQKRLRQELFETFPDPDKIDMKQCLGLKYLDCVVLEIMRLWPILPGPLYRHLGSPITVNGLTVPKGVIASTSAWDQHMRPDIYPEPESFKPSRWYETTDAMKKNWIPFGYGSRSCPGQNLGMTEMKYFLAAVLRHFESVIPEGKEKNVIEMRDLFTAHMWEQDGESGAWGPQVWLKFVPKPHTV